VGPGRTSSATTRVARDSIELVLVRRVRLQRWRLPSDPLVSWNAHSPSRVSWAFSHATQARPARVAQKGSAPACRALRSRAGFKQQRAGPWSDPPWIAGQAESTRGTILGRGTCSGCVSPGAHGRLRQKSKAKHLPLRACPGGIVVAARGPAHVMRMSWGRAADARSPDQPSRSGRARCRTASVLRPQSAHQGCDRDPDYETTDCGRACGSPRITSSSPVEHDRHHRLSHHRQPRAGSWPAASATSRVVIVVAGPIADRPP